MFVVLSLNCSVVLVFVFVLFVVLVVGFCALACFLLHGPGGCVQLVFCQKRHGLGFLLLLALFSEYWK